MLGDPSGGRSTRPDIIPLEPFRATGRVVSQVPTPLARRAELSVRMKRASRASNPWESRWKPRKAYYIDENIRNLEEG